MNFTNAQLINFVDNIKLKKEQKQKYIDQINNLIKELNSSVNNNTDMRVEKVIRAGSWKKGTSLCPKPENPLDIDLVFYLNLDEASALERSQLHDIILEFLLKTYPNKSEEDFKGSKKTVGLVFRGTKLEADIVPVVTLKNNPEYVWQPARNSESKFITSVQKQLEFSTSLKEEDSNYSSVVRMLKTWKNRQELEISSFAIELIQAYLVLSKGKVDNLEDGVIQFFEFLSRETFPTITFKGAINNVKKNSDGPVYIADPTNNENNVLERMEEADWKEVVEAANTAWETLSFAQAKRSEVETVELWKDVFGPSFTIKKKE